MKQYWARHQGRTRWGVRTPLEASERVYTTDGGVFFVWSDKVVIDAGNLVFLDDAGAVHGAIAAGRWDAVFEAGPDDDVPQAIETRR